MISNMAKVIDTSAFTIPETDLADLFSAVVKRDTPDLFSLEAHGRVRRREMHWDQIDHLISILCPVSVENHIFILPGLLPYQADDQNLYERSVAYLLA